MPVEQTSNRPWLEKIVSTKITLEDFRVLNIKTKELYNQNHIELPTVSHLLRWIITGWCKNQGSNQYIKLKEQIDKI
jgi:hypothetical protein